MLKNLIQQIFGERKPTKRRRPTRRGLRMERLDKRSLLAADIGVINGTTYIDLNGNSLDSGDTRLGAVEVRLFRDGGNGVFGGDDTLIGTTTSSSTAGPTLGQYSFTNLLDGQYFVQQTNATAPTGLNFPTPASVTINNRVRLIDDYSNGSQVATATSVNPVVSSSVVSTSAIGGARDIQATHIAGISSVEITVDPVSGQLGISAGAGTNGETLIQYDGNDGSIALNATGLGGISLAGGTPGQAVLPGSALMFSSLADVAGANITVRIYTNATNFSTVTRPIPVGAALTDTTALLLTDFTIGGGTGADFNNVGAIEAFITSPANVDAFVSIVETVRPNIVTANLRNIQPLTIGNLVFQDNNNNGLFDAGDVGLPGVDVQLFALASLADVVNPTTQTPFATVTTGAGGIYSITNVPPGIYAAVIPAYESDATSTAPGSRTLVGYQVSSPATQTPGAEANVDNDNDGRAVTGQLYVATAPFTLISGTEPTNSGNTNNTFDFGFVSNAEVQITKTFVSVDTATDGSRTGTFRIDVLNNGPLTATGIQVIDTLPPGLTFNRVTTTTSTTTAPTSVTSSSVLGNAVTLNLAALASTVGASFNIIVNIAPTVFADQTNSVSVLAIQNDNDLTNNTSTAILDLPQNDLSITKTLETATGNIIPPATARTGDTVVYRISVNNDVANLTTIDDVAAGVSVVDTLPAGVTFVSATINGGPAGQGITFNATNRTVTAAIGTVTRGTPAIILVTVRIDSNAASTLTNTATVSNIPDTDANTANDTASVDSSVGRAVDLTITKAISTQPNTNTTPVYGAPLTFVITVTNTATSPGVARGFTVADVLPAGLSLVAGSFVAGTSGVTLAPTGQTLNFTSTNDLAIGASASFTFDVLVAQNAVSAPITNTAVVAATNNQTIVDTDVVTTNNSDDETFTPARNIELVVTKDDNFTGTTTANPGGNIIYTIVVTNTGTSNAINVNVLDTLPAGVTATSITVSGNQVTDNNPDLGLLGFTLPLVATGAANAVTVTVNASIAASVTAANITNQVTVSGGGVGDLPAGNTASVTTPLAPSVEVAIVKTGPATAIPGGTAIAYNLAITNTGVSNATNVSVSDTLPPGVTIQSVTLNGTAVANTGTAGNVVFVIPTLAPGASNTANAVITVSIDPAATGTLTNTATVTAAGDSPAGNTSTTQTVLNPTADVTVTKTVNNPTAVPGDALTYTIIVRNGGVSTAAGVTLVDVLPAGVTFTSGTGPNGLALTATGQTVNVAVGTLAPAATATYTIIGSIAANTNGALVNTATVATTTPEGANALANTASVTTNVLARNASIAGRVFSDINRNGRIDGSDFGIAGVTMTLRQNGSTAVLRTTTTDALGNYLFDNLTAGTYSIEQEQPIGFGDGLEQAGPNATPVDSGNTLTGIVVPASTALTQYNFAEVELLSKRRFLASTVSN